MVQTPAGGVLFANNIEEVGTYMLVCLVWAENEKENKLIISNTNHHVQEISVQIYWASCMFENHVSVWITLSWSKHPQKKVY